jgi:tetratricopeptide (TPR) repeat protein
MKLKFAPLGVLSLLLISCASTQVSFFTNPTEVKVFAKPLGEGKRTLLGQTPLITPVKNIANLAQSTGPLMIEFEKDGYETRSMVLSDIDVNNLLLNVEMKPAFRAGDQATLNWLVENSFEVQRLAKSQRFEESLKILAEMRRVAPLVAMVHEMLGGIYYAKGEYKESFDSYSEALKLNPRSIEAFKMTNLLREHVGREPASEDESGR